MPTLRKLRQLPVKEALNDIATFINRELVPFLNDLLLTTTTVEGEVGDIPQVTPPGGAWLGDAEDGLDGHPGRDGKDGAQGDRGGYGIDGEDGLDGIPGAPGKDGATGSPGTPGLQGEDGLDGLPGQPGRDGRDGLQGTPGYIGVDGEDGLDGRPGRDGLVGPQGLQGPPNYIAVDGEDGLDGAPGMSIVGPQGLPGTPGTDGVDGDDGLQGVPGSQGIQGLQGLPGAPGRDGIDGEDGLMGPPGPGVSDGDHGDVTVAGFVWTVDVDINKAWTGVHSFTSSTFTVATTGDTSIAVVDDLLLAATTGSVSIAAGAAASGTLSDGFVGIQATADVLIGATSGIGLFAGHTPVAVDGGDIVLNATSGIVLNADGATALAGIAQGVHLSSATDIRARASGGIGLFANLTDSDVTDSDLVLNALGGMGLTTNATTPRTSITNGNIEFDAYGRFIFTTPSFFQVEIANDAWIATTAGGIQLSTLNAGVPTGVTNGQINLTSQSSINCTAGTAFTATASSGSCTLTSSTATCTFNCATSLVVNTNSVERLEITSVGAWELAGLPGSRGDSITSFGSSAPPAWEQRTFSSITARSSLSSTTPRVLATKTFAANEAVSGTAYRYAAQVRVFRGSTATPVIVVLELRVGGTMIVEINGNLNTTNGFLGSIRIEGEIFFHDAPGAAALYTVNMHGLNCLTAVSTAPVVILDLVDATKTAATNAALTVDIRASMSAVVAGVDIVPVSAYLERIIL